MQFNFNLTLGQKLVVNKAFWTGKTEVLLDNVIQGTMKGFGRQETFRIKYKDDSEHSLLIKHPILDPMPMVVLDGNDLTAAERFSPLQTALICAPILLILQLGAIPALLGTGSVYLNFFIARQPSLTPPVRWAAIGLVPVLGLIIVSSLSAMLWGTVKDKKDAQAQTHHYDPTEDDNDPRQWARPRGNAAEAERQERWVREGR